jgi:phosphopantetheine--protein transferase-like protein
MVSKSFTELQWHDFAKLNVRLASFAPSSDVDADELHHDLSLAERDIGAAIGDASERRHFLIRRAFQRHFVARIAGWTGALSDIPMRHQRDQRTVCDVLPDMTLSFSSSQGLYCASASRMTQFGLDIEKRRPVSNLENLARRFFAEEEAEALLRLPIAARDDAFLRIWTAKEAALKALGLGIVSGLNRFIVAIGESTHVIRDAGDTACGMDWRLTYLDLREDFICAVVHNSSS